MDHVRTLAVAKDAAPGQVALARMPAQWPCTVTIPAPGEPALSPRAPPRPKLALAADEVEDLNRIAAQISVRGEAIQQPAHG